MKCKAVRCTNTTDGSSFCARHWAMLPTELHERLIATYKGRRRFSPRYAATMGRAVRKLAELEYGGEAR